MWIKIPHYRGIFLFFFNLLDNGEILQSRGISYLENALCMYSM